MKKMKFVLFAVLLGFVLIGGCKKTEYDAAGQLATDEKLIKAYLTTNNITAERHDSGIYYQIIDPGEGNFTYSANTNINVKYKGRLLNGSVFDQNATGVSFVLGRLIYGWQIGIQLIQPGGKIRLFVPSGYAYGPAAQGGIPANSVLDFDIELVGVEIIPQ